MTKCLPQQMQGRQDQSTRWGFQKACSAPSWRLPWRTQCTGCWGWGLLSCERSRWSPRYDTIHQPWTCGAVCKTKQTYLIKIKKNSFMKILYRVFNFFSKFWGQIAYFKTRKKDWKLGFLKYFFQTKYSYIITRARYLMT